MDNKYCGQPTDYAPVVEDRSRVVFSYDLQPVKGKELVTWREVVFFKKQGAPTLEAVKRAIIEDINRHTDEKILKGFVWKNMNVWLSEENQRNFSEAQRLAIVPITFKISENEDGTPVYHVFEKVDELNDFYSKAVGYVQQCLQEGWNEKDGIDWSVYEGYFGSEKTTTRKKK